MDENLKLVFLMVSGFIIILLILLNDERQLELIKYKNNKKSK